MKRICTAYLPKTGYECFCPVKIYSTTIVKATVVRLRVVYMGTFIPRTDSIVTNFHRKSYQYASGEGKLNYSQKMWMVSLCTYHVKQIRYCKRKSVNQRLQWYKVNWIVRSAQWLSRERNNLPAFHCVQQCTWRYHLKQTFRNHSKQNSVQLEYKVICSKILLKQGGRVSILQLKETRLLHKTNLANVPVLPEKV